MKQKLFSFLALIALVPALVLTGPVVFSSTATRAKTGVGITFSNNSETMISIEDENSTSNNKNIQKLPQTNEITNKYFVMVGCGYKRKNA